MTTSPQSIRIHPDSLLPSTPINDSLLTLTFSITFSDNDLAWRLDVAEAIIIESAKEEIFLTSKAKISSALLSSSAEMQISCNFNLGKFILV